jgi:uncharacterized membrane protein YjjP (DUF1212 family)
VDQEHEIGFVLALARALHRYGTPTYRLEEAIDQVCGLLGLEAETFSTPTTIIMSFGAPTELRTRMMRLDGGVLDLGKLAQVDALGDAVAAQQITPAEGRRQLDALIAAPPQFGGLTTTIASGASSAGLAAFFSGGLADCALAGAIGLALGVLATFVRRSTDQARVLELLAGAFAAFCAALASAWWPAVSPSVVTVAALIIFLPGMSLTVAMTELATRSLIAGTARLMSAVIVLLELVVGVAIGERAAASLVHVHATAPAGLPEWALWVALAVSAVGTAVVVQAQLRAFGWIVAACVVGYLGTRVGTAWLGGQMGVLVGALGLGVLANAYARWLHRPAQVVLVPAVLLLVPGSMGLRGMTSMLDRDTVGGVETVFTMFVVAIAIVGGLLVSNAVVSPRRHL